MIGQTEFIITPKCTQLRHTCASYINICTQPTSAVMLIAAKSEKLFQDAIMLVISIKIDLQLLKVVLIFLSKILLSRCVDYFVKGIKTLVFRAWLSYTSTWEFLLTLEKCERHFSRVLKKFPCVYITQQCTRHIYYSFSKTGFKLTSNFTCNIYT